MLVFVDANLVLFAVPKTGSTAYHLALRGWADITFSGKPAVKHMSLRKYDRHFAPFLKAAYKVTPDRVAVMRDPEDQLRSWYKYRSRDGVPKGNAVPSGMSFDQFVEEAIAEQPAKFAAVGSQFSFLTNNKGELRTNHLFAYERPVKLQRFLSERLGKSFETQQKNVSPYREARLSAAVAAKLRAARAEEFALYEAVMAADGHLQTPSTG